MGQTAFCQEKKLTKSEIKISALFPEMILEFALADAISVKSGFSMIPVGYTSINEDIIDIEIKSLKPRIQAMPRVYTTRVRRDRKGKSSEHFSGGYLGLPIDFILDVGKEGGVVYGSQGTFKNSNFFYDFNFGVGAFSHGEKKYQKTVGLQLRTAFRIGYILKSSNK